MKICATRSMGSPSHNPFDVFGNPRETARVSIFDKLQGSQYCLTKTIISLYIGDNYVFKAGYFISSTDPKDNPLFLAKDKFSQPCRAKSHNWLIRFSRYFTASSRSRQWPKSTTGWPGVGRHGFGIRGGSSRKVVRPCFHFAFTQDSSACDFSKSSMQNSLLAPACSFPQICYVLSHEHGCGN